MKIIFFTHWFREFSLPLISNSTTAGYFVNEQQQIYLSQMSHLPSSAEISSRLLCFDLLCTRTCSFPSFFNKKMFMTIRPIKSYHPVDWQSVIGRFCFSSALITVYIWFSFNVDTLGQNTGRIHWIFLIFNSQRTLECLKNSIIF